MCASGYLVVNRAPSVVRLPGDVRWRREPSQSIEDLQVRFTLNRFAVDVKNSVAALVLDHIFQKEQPLLGLFVGVSGDLIKATGFQKLTHQVSHCVDESRFNVSNLSACD